MQIAYIIPAFPSQTHVFFWRERQALEKLGVKAAFISTRRPPKKLVSHSWSQQAIEETTYLFPPRLSSMPGTLLELLKAGPCGWWRAASAVARADGCSLKQKTLLLPLVWLGASVVRLARKRGWTHIHAHSCADSANIALFAHLLSGLPYSLTLHGPLEHYGPNQRQKWSNAKFAVVITERLLREVREKVKEHLPSVVSVAPMGVDLEAFKRKKQYVPYTGRGPIRIFSCGRLHPGKGHADLLRAVHSVLSHGLKVKVAIAGEGKTRKELEALVKEYKLEASVTFLGAVSEERVAQELEAAHVFCLASHAEPLGVAIMEAMAMSVPVIVTNAGGVPSLVEHNVHGLLVEPRDSNGVAQAILHLSQSPGKCMSLGCAGKVRIKEKFSSLISARCICQNVRATEHDANDECESEGQVR